MSKSLNIVFFGPSILSAYCNSGALYYRAIIRALFERGHKITYYEPDTPDSRLHRDISEPPWAAVIPFADTGKAGIADAAKSASHCNVIVKIGRIGNHDSEYDASVLSMKQPSNLIVYWDSNPLSTLRQLDLPPEWQSEAVLSGYDLVLTTSGGESILSKYQALGAKKCVTVFGALDEDTHHPVTEDEHYKCDLAFLGSRLSEREERIDEYFVRAAKEMPYSRFILGGSNWDGKQFPANVSFLGYINDRDHNAFNCTPRAVLNVSGINQASLGISPSPRIFEAAGAGACIVTDDWPGLELFLKPGEECLVAHSGIQVAEHLRELVPARARHIGQQARQKVLSQHTYTHRAAQVEAILNDLLNRAPH